MGDIRAWLLGGAAGCLQIGGFLQGLDGGGAGDCHAGRDNRGEPSAAAIGQVYDLAALGGVVGRVGQAGGVVDGQLGHEIKGTATLPRWRALGERGEPLRLFLGFQKHDHGECAGKSCPGATRTSA